MPLRKRSPYPVLRQEEIEKQFCLPQDGRQLAPEAFWHLLALYNRRSDQYRSRLRRCVYLMGLTYLLSVVDALNDASYCAASMGVSCCLVVLYIVLRYSAWSNRPVADAIRALSRIRTSTDIKPLIAMLEYDNGLPVRYDLARLLEGFQPSGNAALADWEKWYLRLCMERAVRQRNERVAIAALRALQRAGVTAALPRVRRFARFADEDTIRDAARDCLQVLKSQAERERTGRMLLRATRAPEACFDALLRPADDALDPQPQQLLRTPTPQED